MKAQRIASGLLLAGAVVFVVGYRDVLGNDCSGTKVGQDLCPKDPGPGVVASCVGLDKAACPTKYLWEAKQGPFICNAADNPPSPVTECGLAGKMTPLGWQPSLTDCAQKASCYWDDFDGSCRLDVTSTTTVKDYYKANICPLIVGPPPPPPPE